MAAVRTEDEAFSDVRYVELAALAGLADADHARGKMLNVWRQCTLEQTYVLSAHVVRHFLGNSGVEALIGSRLGELLDDGRVRIRGTRGRIEWLQKLRNNGKYGKRGGRPKKNPDGFPAANPDGLETKTPLATAIATASSPAQRSKKQTRAREAGVTLPDGWAPNETHRRIAAELKRDLAAETLDFCDQAMSKGYVYLDWDAAFRKWLRNENFRRPATKQPERQQSLEPVRQIRTLTP